MVNWDNRIAVPALWKLLSYWAGATALALAIVLTRSGDYLGPAVAAMFAGMSAILAALIAYSAATAKTGQDRQIEDEKRREIKSDLVLKTGHAARTLADRLEALRTRITLLDTDDQIAISVLVGLIRYQMAVPKSDQLDDAWDKLSAFDRPMIVALRELTGALDDARECYAQMVEHVERDALKSGRTVRFSDLAGAKALRERVDRAAPLAKKLVYVISDMPIPSGTPERVSGSLMDFGLFSHGRTPPGR